MRVLAAILLMTSLGYAGVACGDLIWQKEVTFKGEFGDPEIVTTVQYYCDQLRHMSHLGWRVPTVTELKGIVGHGQEPKGEYWSSSKVTHGSSTALVVDSITGVVRQESVLNSHWVRCVRDS